VATRSIIAVPHNGGWQGRYCHWDGYPDAKVSELLLLVSRDGLDKVRKTIMKHEWSSLHPNPDKLAEMWHGADDFVRVYGYGIAYGGKPHRFTHNSKQFAWAQFLYVLGDNEVSVYEAVETGGTPTWKPVKKHKYLRTKVSV